MALGEAPVKQAVRWISEERDGGTKKTTATLIDEACQRFNLSPLDAEFLYRNFSKDTVL